MIKVRCLIHRGFAEPGMGGSCNKMILVKGFGSPVLITHKEILPVAKKIGTRALNRLGTKGSCFKKKGRHVRGHVEEEMVLLQYNP